MPTAKVNPDNLVVDLVIDHQVQPTLFLASTEAHKYKFELLDIHAAIWLYRAYLVPGELYTQTLVSLNKGSCDLNRAGAELHHLDSQSSLLDWLLVAKQGAFSDVVSVDPRQVPKTPWSQLDLNGDLVTRFCAHIAQL